MSDLHRAARDNNIRLLDRILATPGINVDATDRHGRTPLHCAAQHGSDKTLEALLRAGASSHAKSFDGKTPLSLAMEHRHSAVSFKRMICSCNAQLDTASSACAHTHTTHRTHTTDRATAPANANTSRCGQHHLQRQREPAAPFYPGPERSSESVAGRAGVSDTAESGFRRASSCARAVGGYELVQC